LQGVAWQQNPEYRARTCELLQWEGWSPLLGELLGFLQRLETAPTTCFGSPGQREGGDTKPHLTEKKRGKRGRPADTDPRADKRIFEAWRSGHHTTYADLATALGQPEQQVRAAIDRHRKRLGRGNT